MSALPTKINKFKSYLGFGLIAFMSLSLAACDSIEERIQAHYESGLELAQQGETTKAGLEFRNALSLNNDFVPALFELGKVEFKNLEIIKAVNFYRKIIDIDKSHVGARVELARIFLLANQINEAEKLIDEAFALDSNAAEILVIKSAVALKLRKTDDAVKYANQVLEKEPQNIDAITVLASERMLAKDYNSAIEFLNKGQKGDSGYVNLQILKLNALAALSDKQEMEMVFQEIIEIQPENSAIRYAFARWYFAEGRRDDSERILREYSNENPNDNEAGLNLVNFIRLEKGNEAAKNELVKLIEKGSGKSLDYGLAMAEFEFAEKNNESAMEIIEKLATENAGTPEGIRAQLYLAQKQIQFGRRDEAEKLIDIILAEDDKNTTALRIKASLLLAKQDEDGAIEKLLIAVNLAPNSAEIRRTLAIAYERAGKIELAEENLVKAVQINEFEPQSGLSLSNFLLRHGKSSHADNILDRIVQASPDDTTTLLQIARRKLSQKDWDGAAEIADRLEKIDPKNKVKADQIRATVYVAQQKFDDSIKILEKSLENEDPRVRAASQAGLFNVYLRSQQYDEAKKLIDEDLAQNPNSLLAHLRSGLLHYLEKDFDKAEASYEKAIEVNPKSPGGYYSLAEFYRRRGDVVRAVEVSKRGLEVAPQSNQLRFFVAQTLEFNGQFTEAIAEYKILHKTRKQSTVFANNLASLLSDYGDGAGDLDLAFEIAHVRFRNTNVPQFQDTLGWIHYLRAEYADAVSYLKRAADGLPNVGVVHYHLGKAYKALGRNDLALGSLQHAATLTKDSEFNGKQDLLATLTELEAIAKQTSE